VTAPFNVEPLSDHHDRAGFMCGLEPLDRYLRQQAGQDAKRRLSSCFVAVDQARSRIAGYYTLSMAGIALADLPADVVRRLPRYPMVPAARLGRLAVDRDYRGRGLGGALLWDALVRVSRSDVAAFALLVDAKDEAAVAFYRHHGFIAFGAMPRTLFLPLASAPGRRAP
jgi:ribosomal protein S18 acetylase RimI-like enzyme